MEAVLGTEVSTKQSLHQIYPLRVGKSDALVIHCSDSRFQDAFHNFLREELSLKRPAIIVLPGSTASFGVQVFFPKRWYALRNQIELMAELNDFSRVIIINHDDCLGYASVAKFLGGLANISTSQHKHIKGMAGYILREYLPNAQVELYQAKLVQDGESKGVRFERIV